MKLRSQAEAITAEFNLLAPDAPLCRYRQVRLAATLGDREAVISLLADSYANKDAELPFLAIDPRFDAVREVPQVADIIKKVRSGTSE